MATNKPDLTRVWAAGAPPGNVVDPDTTTPGKFNAGWVAEVPPFEHFNFLQNLFTAGLVHANEQGIMVWDTDTVYPQGGLAKGSNGVVYTAIVEQNGNDPVTDDGSNWRPRDPLTVVDFGAVGDGVTDDSPAFQAAKDYRNGDTVLAPFTPDSYLVSTWPPIVQGDRKNWLYDFWSDAKPILTAAGVRGGWFSDWDCEAGQSFFVQTNKDLTTIEGGAGGAFRDAMFVQHQDLDEVDYTAIGQRVSHGIRVYTTGAHDGAAYQSQYKDLVASSFVAIGRIDWAARGVSAVTADAVQFGEGIASNEFAVLNPSVANDGISQSKSMAAVQAIIRSQFAAADSGHTAHGVLISNEGETITSGVELQSIATGGFVSHFQYGIFMRNAIVTQVGIVMPQSATGDIVGSIIEYDANDFSLYDAASDIFRWSIGNIVQFTVGAEGIALANLAPIAGTFILVPASTASKGHIRLVAGADVISPSDGDLWYEGTNLKFRQGGTTRTINWT